MVGRVLEAYEEEVMQKKLPYIKRMGFWAKCILWAYIIGFIVFLILIIFFHKFQLYLIGLIYCITAQYVVIAILERIRHKKWESNIKDYNDELNKIKEILKREEFNLYDKIKIKQLIRKYYQDINQHNQNYICKNNEIRDFTFTYIIPIVAFFVGKINNTFFSSDSEWIIVGIVIICMVALTKYAYKSFVELAGLISWNVLEKEKTFVCKLQDLLDRDFVIYQEDLISMN